MQNDQETDGYVAESEEVALDFLEQHQPYLSLHLHLVVYYGQLLIDAPSVVALLRRIRGAGFTRSSVAGAIPESWRRFLVMRRVITIVFEDIGGPSGDSHCPILVHIRRDTKRTVFRILSMVDRDTEWMDPDACLEAYGRFTTRMRTIYIETAYDRTRAEIEELEVGVDTIQPLPRVVVALAFGGKPILRISGSKWSYNEQGQFVPLSDSSRSRVPFDRTQPARFVPLFARLEGLLPFLDPGDKHLVALFDTIFHPKHAGSTHDAG